MISKTNIEVIYADTDLMGVVYHGSYIAMLERGRNQYIKDAGFSMKYFSDFEVMFPVYKVELEYKYPVKYQDDVVIETSIIEFSKIKTVYLQQIYVDNILCLDAKIGVAHVNAKTFKPVNLSKVMPEFFNEYTKVMNNE